MSFPHGKLESPLKPVWTRFILVILAIALALAVNSLVLADLWSVHSSRIVLSGIMLTAAAAALVGLFTYLLRPKKQKMTQEMIAVRAAALEQILATIKELEKREQLKTKTHD